MKGDFSRHTFDKKNLFSRVLMQQGRVTLDADYNEQVEILLHYLRTLARDLIGPYAAPAENPGFKLVASGDNKNFSITAGRYYVDGILVENAEPCSYSKQPNHWPPKDDEFLKRLENIASSSGIFWVYLDVWERHVTSLDDDAIREKALGGPDTCTRAKVMWQVKAHLVDKAYQPYGYPYPGYGPDGVGLPCEEPLRGLVDISQVRLAARVDPGRRVESACVTPPDSKYRGVENHLYRVEIDRGGKAGEATFKWSRDNGSVVTAWLQTRGNDLEVANARGFSAGNWVELSDEVGEQQGVETGKLVRVAKVEGSVLSIDPASIPAGGLPQASALANPKVTRWDQVEAGDVQLVDGAVPVRETLATEDADKADWIDLEDGIQVTFTQAPYSSGGTYRAGDYWLIPARVASGNIEWPAARDPKKLSLVEPAGDLHHFAPLGYVSFQGGELKIQGCWCEFGPLSDCFNARQRAFGEHLLRLDYAEVDRQRALVRAANAPAAEGGSAATVDEAAARKAPAKTASKSAKKAPRRAPAKEAQGGQEGQ